MSIFDTFMLGMMAPTFVVAIVVIGYRFIKDMNAHRCMDKKRAKAARNSFRWNRANGTMAVRNK